MPKFACLIIALLYLSLAEWAYAEDNHHYDVHYQVTLLPASGVAKVSINIPDASPLSRLEFNLDSQIHSQVSANGKLERDKALAIWQPPKKDARLTLDVKINHQRNNSMFDAMMTKDWAIFRGDDLVPPVKVRSKRHASSRSTLSFILPETWKTVETGWERDKSKPKQEGQVNAPNFIIDNPERRFDRPVGWMIVGNLGTRRAKLGDTSISVSAPQNTQFHRMDILTFLHFLWPEIQNAFGKTPKKLLIVGGDDPMWRGGLSASNSLFLHADRPLVSENGTSTLIHEIVHMVTRIRGTELDDWIAEGLAEYYAIELLFRSGGINAQRRDIIKDKLKQWSKDVTKLRIARSSGPTTAKAVLMFYKLDEEIREQSGGRKRLDDLTQVLMVKRKVSFSDLKQACKTLLGETCNSLSVISASNSQQ